MLQTLAFYGFALLSGIASLVMITRRQPVAAVMWLVVLVLGIAGLFFTLQAEFLGVMQFFLYGDAITVIFIFIIMSMNLPDEQLPVEKLSVPATIAVGACGIVFGMLLVGVENASSLIASPASTFGQLSTFARVLFEEHLLAFEAISVLLLIAIVGVVVLSRKSVVE